MSNESYGEAMSESYDSLNSDIDYVSWADFLEECIKRFSETEVKHICEIACGTGKMSVILSKRGYKLTSSDLSEDMLCFAEMRAREENCKNITFTKQDMRSFTASNKAGAVVCLLDSVNCLLKPDEVKQCFASAAKILVDGGVFLFDVNSKYKFENIYADNAYVLENENVLCAWENYYNEKTHICDFYLSFFKERSDGLYERNDEHRRERMYTVRSIEKYLAESGLSLCGVFSDFDFTKGDETKDERLYFAAVKNK